MGRPGIRPGLLADSFLSRRPTPSPGPQRDRIDGIDETIASLILHGALVKQGLAHHTLTGNHITNPVLEVTLMQGLRRIEARLGCGRERRLQYAIPDVAAAHFVLLRQS